MNQRTCAFIFARGGSKGLPKKNILKIGGIPLLAHSIRTAHNLSEVDRVFVSTDCDEIASVAMSYGADVINRPPELATDTSPEWKSWQHAIQVAFERYTSFDRFLSLPTTSPLRSLNDVRNCLSALREDVDIVLTMTPSCRSPWFNMVTVDSNSNVKLLESNSNLKRRQDAKICFDLTTVAYVSRPDYILKASSIWDGSVVGVEIPRERAVDIDDQYDFEIASFLMQKSLQPRVPFYG